MATKKTKPAVRPEPLDSGQAASTGETTDVARLLAELSAQVTALAERLARLEGTAAPAPAPAAEAKPAPAAEARPAPTPPPRAAAVPPAAAAPELGEEELLAVSAALAAFFGVRMRIRNIRLLSSQAWAQQGRVSIQASHRLHN